MREIEIITDGSCKPNPGKGGWAAILREGQTEREIWGSAPQTTNNRMELMAVIEALRRLEGPHAIELVTDSNYVKNGITQWIHNWKRRDWITSGGTPVLNHDLWVDLDALVAEHEITWKWTKGHADHEDNNRCDELACQAAIEQSASKE